MNILFALLLIGGAYDDTVWCAKHSPQFCEWPQDEREEDGSAYEDAQNAAEDADCHDDYEKEEAPEEVGYHE